ncbi:MAG TPA: glutamyl-tRNA reductase [Candidatus Angelobacter sp.]|nr:glutamyl-tRNA reductase [Candidatus Angelobacter sp.]
MTLLVVGISHRSAPVALLDRLALVDDAASRLQVDLLGSPHVAESLVLSTCNRVEIYAEVSKFHGGVVDVTESLAKATGVPRDELTPHLYVRYEDRAVQHMFEVASGLDSMVVGEQQIIGQVRSALRSAQETATAGRSLNDLAQAALRVGKRVHQDTGIDRAGASVVSVALHLAAHDFGGTLDGRRALVVGAGAMSSLAATQLRRSGVTDIVIANRTYSRGARLAAQVGGVAIELSTLADVLPDVDVVVSCTGSTGLVLTEADIAAARFGATTPLVVVDLALPHDAEVSIGQLAGVRRIDLAALAELPEANAPERDVELARSIVADEVRAHLSAMAALRVEPIVVSLRARADQVVEAELQRLRMRLPELDDAAAAELARSLRRAVSTLLHTPTVRMKELAADPDGARYATALHRLFDLDPAAIEALTTADEPTTAGESTPADPSYDDLLGGLS